MTRHAAPRPAPRRRRSATASPATRVDRAVSAVLGDRQSILPTELGAELAAARALRADLPLVPAGPRFEEALARRLSQAIPGPAGGPGPIQRFAHLHPRLVLTSALGSVLVGAAAAALVVAWRLAHR